MVSEEKDVMKESLAWHKGCVVADDLGMDVGARGKNMHRIRGSI